MQRWGGDPPPEPPVRETDIRREGGMGRTSVMGGTSLMENPSAKSNCAADGCSDAGWKFGAPARPKGSSSIPRAKRALYGVPFSAPRSSSFFFPQISESGVHSVKKNYKKFRTMRD